MQVTQLGDTVFQVESEKSADKNYIVTWGTEHIDGWPNHWSCTCTNYAVQRNKAVGRGDTTPYQCKHVFQVERFGPVAEETARRLADEARQQEEQRGQKTLASLLELEKSLRE